MYLLKRILNYLIKFGTLTIINYDGSKYIIKGAKPPEPLSSVCIRFRKKNYALWLALSPSVALGKGYTRGDLSLETGTIDDFIKLIFLNIERIGFHKCHSIYFSLDVIFRRLHQFNPIQKSIKNVAHHYDLSNNFYRLFLDEDMQYSCAYFKDHTNDIHTAQLNKKIHIAKKLMINKDHSLLDIGCGWGGMGLFIGKEVGARVKGITLSKEQLQVAKQRAQEAKLSDKVSFELCDYRVLNEKFDRIVSVGMFEHVGVNHFAEFFDKLYNNLSEDGVALLHTIGRIGPPSNTDPWIRKYIFPGGYIPSLSEIMPYIEKTKLIVTDIEYLGLHYAKTLKLWAKQFEKNKSQIKSIFDEDFYRMWEYYLAASQMAFRHLDLTVFQIQISKNRKSQPLTRDYMI